jgi:hypothetical protein
VASKLLGGTAVPAMQRLIGITTHGRRDALVAAAGERMVERMAPRGAVENGRSG